jgi:UDP-N-acetylglucosamine 2-epimerase
LGVPVVNIGSRQNRRDRGNNVIDVGYDSQSIRAAVEEHVRMGQSTPSHVYGGGNAGHQIAEKLAQVPLVFHKTIQF